MTGNGKVREISLGDDLGDVAVKVNGVRVEVHADESVAVYTKSDVDAYTTGAVHLHSAVNDSFKPAAQAERKVGDRMPDGTIYAGISPDSLKAMYTTPEDGPLTYTFIEAGRYAAKLQAHGYHDWRVPTKAELTVLFNNRAAIGGFDVTGSYPAGWYWSSTENNRDTAWAQRFSGEDQYGYFKKHDSSLRCVR